MLASINIHSSVPVYEQIENHVQFAISGGDLKAGDRLGVNFNTVAKSYRDLEVMGIIYTRRGMGCFINKGIEAKCRDKCRAHVVTHMHEVVQEAKAAGLHKKDVTSVVSASMASDSNLYGEVPDSVMKFAKASH